MWAEQYIGLPYVEHGRDRAGVDCWGLARLVMAEVFHVELPEYSNSGNREERLRLIAENRVKFVRVESPVEGALVLASSGNRRPHIGICVNAEQMLHAAKGIGACIVRLDSPQWRNAVSGYYLPYCR